MNAFFSLRRGTLALVLTVLGFTVQVSAALAGDLQVTGTFVVQSTNGANTEVAEVGHAKPGGKFVGTFTGKQSPGNSNVRGVHTWIFGNGDTLTLYTEFQFDAALGQFVGIYVVTGGTGKLAGAKGSGVFGGVPAGDGTGTFSLVGSLSH